MRMNRRFLLLDGTASLYQSFFAIKELTTHAGIPTNATYGFIRMFRQIVMLRKPTHVAVIFDGGLPQSRLLLQPDYKANRRPMPSALKMQINFVQEFLDLAGIVWIREEGEEADDVMASMATWAEDETNKIMIATSDKDIYQIVSQKKVVIPMSGKGDEIGPNEVEQKTGVPPRLIVDWLALTGDSIDNIPGVPGIGPKTAAMLLQQYGSAESLLSHLNELENVKLREKLSQHAECIRRNLKLIQLKTNIECPIEWEKIELHEPDFGKLSVFFEKMEFASLLRDLMKGSFFVNMERNDLLFSC